MKIQSIRPRIGRCTRHRLAAICSAVLIGAAGSGQATAQSPQAGAPSVAGSAHSSVAAQGGQLMHGGESFRVIGSSSVPTAVGAGEEIIQIEPGEEFVEWETAPPPGVTRPGGHARHGGHAGHGHGGHPHHGHGPAPGAVHGAIQSGLHGHAGVCGPACQPYHYVTVEGLYMQQSEYEDYTFTDDYIFDSETDTDEFGFEWAPRVTIGSVPDCVNGWEASFTGPLEWDMDGTFDDGDFYEAEYWSAEINRTHIAWDAAKLLLGVRYIDYEEGLGHDGDPDDDTDDNLLDAENSLIGGQIGADILYPVAQHVSADFRGRAGAYLNLVDVEAIDDSVPYSPEDEGLAGMFEIGGGLRYHFSDMLSVRGGGELWYLAGMATAPGQITPLRNRVDDDDEILIYGLTATAELRF